MRKLPTSRDSPRLPEIPRITVIHRDTPIFAETHCIHRNTSMIKESDTISRGGLLDGGPPIARALRFRPTRLLVELESSRLRVPLCDWRHHTITLSTSSLV